MKRKIRLAVLASGRGSNFAAIAGAVLDGRIANAVLAGLVCNKPEAGALAIAKAGGIPSEVVPSDSFREGKKLDRARYELELVKAVEKLSPDFVCLAGYLLLLGPTLLKAWPDRIINIHPSLLPSFKGLHAHRQAIEYGCRVAGCTVHFVNEELDGGAIIAQDTIEVRDGDTEDTLSERLLPVEHRTYVAALARLCTRGYRIDGRRVIWD